MHESRQQKKAPVMKPAKVVMDGDIQLRENKQVSKEPT